MYLEHNLVPSFDHSKYFKMFKVHFQAHFNVFPPVFKGDVNWFLQTLSNTIITGWRKYWEFAKIHKKILAKAQF